MSGKTGNTRIADGWADIARKAAGWRVAPSDNGYRLRFYPPDGGNIVTVGRYLSFSDRGALNARAMLRKAGLDI